MKMKKILSLGLAAVTAFSMLAVTGCGDKSSGKDDTFSWWIYTIDGNGLYDVYEDNPAVEWLNQQIWDVENHTIAKDGKGNSLKFEFQAPIAGSESDNFNTMMGTGEYTDIIDLCVSSDNAKTLYEDGITIELTDYVEKYCPNYVDFLEKNPDVSEKVRYADEDGNYHYYSMAAICDGNAVPWDGYIYRRDWVVKYCEPTDYVWDLESDYVKENGHPAVTPLSEAKAQNNLEGWKANDVTTFKVINDGGDDPSNNYEDNVIFPSGRDYPYTISDWEWMFEGFQKAIDERGWKEDKDAYCTTVYYSGFLATGDLVSSFGGGNGTWAKDMEGNVTYSGTSENFKTYLEAMNNWYEKGWLDKAFTERGADPFYAINMNGFTTGKVGLWIGYTANLGDGIRITCLNEEDAKDAYCMGCPLPVNDVYGSDDQMYHDPDGLFQGGRIDGQIAITEKAKDKDLETLFTFFNWLYTQDGAATRKLGLSKEQLASAEINNNLYEKNNIDGAYELLEDEDGNTVYKMNYDTSADITGCITFGRLAVGITTYGVDQGLGYTVDRGEPKVLSDALQKWNFYTNTADVTLNYGSLFTNDENKAYAKVNNTLQDYIGQEVPKLIKEGLGGWDEYVEKINGYDVESISKIYEKYTK